METQHPQCVGACCSAPRRSEVDVPSCMIVIQLNLFDLILCAGNLCRLVQTRGTPFDFFGTALPKGKADVLP